MLGKVSGVISLSDKTQALLHDPEISDLQIPLAALPYILAKRAQSTPLLVVTHSSKRAAEVAEELTALMEKVIEFPAWESLPHEKLSPNKDTVSRRINTLYRGVNSQIIVTPVKALLQPINSTITEPAILIISKGSKVNFTQFIKDLSDRAFSRVDMVERRGDFAVRGGIIDLFPPLSEHPIRIDFFGDEIDDIRYFEISNQRTIEPLLGEIELLPCREILITDQIKKRATEIAKNYPELREMAEKISEGIYVEGMEALSGVLNNSLLALPDFLDENREIIILEKERVRNRALDLIRTSEEFLEAAWSNVAMGADERPLRTELIKSGYLNLEDLQQKFSKRSWRNFNVIADENSTKIDQLEEISSYNGNFETILLDLRRWLAQGYLVLISLEGHGLVERYSQLLREADIPLREVLTSERALESGLVYLIQSKIRSSVVDRENKRVILTEATISGSRDLRSSAAKMPRRRKESIDPLELNEGDYVVHEHHGVGRYLELVERKIAGASREYLVIEYASSKRGQPADRIYVPTDALELISRYVGGESPTVHRIGSGDWSRAKTRARKAVKEIAGELIRLYAARTSLPGFAFSPDTTWQAELEDSFSYIETPDQLVTINEVKSDMEKPYPMDRIVCGDVGYGKTEIAVRAAFKAVQDGKQVALLVPTTLLAQQHLATFTSRYTGFPVKVAALSRFNSQREIKETIKGLELGSIDIVIGTHRLLSEDVQFKDLGLIVVDEEQRFGVEHKEKLKKLRTTIDVLSMSATPIPRTLEMAITGIRELSTIATPPEERHPVLTYVGPYNEKQVIAAIHREMLRDGQVFYIHNRVESIDEAAARLRRLIPEARVAIAHGQMNESVLEEVVLAFWNREFDILVCTTIVENGIDVANANTLIVEKADSFGLSQLHQLRGRVGRSRDRAYAYFLYPPDKPLSEVALDRLTTIAKNTELGSGMHVALKDLEIRGAGNLLGGEQSGHIADVGFDLYMRMVGEAVEEFKHGIIDSPQAQLDCKVELPITAHLSDEYVPSDRLRLDLYRRLAHAKSDQEVEGIRAELIDRFGEPPQEAVTLLSIAHLRVWLREHHLGELALQGRYLKLSPLTLTDSQLLRIQRLYPGSIVKSATEVVLVARPAQAAWSQASEMGDTSLLKWVDEVLQTIFTSPGRK